MHLKGSWLFVCGTSWQTWEIRDMPHSVNWVKIHKLSEKTAQDFPLHFHWIFIYFLGNAFSSGIGYLIRKWSSVHQIGSQKVEVHSDQFGSISNLFSREFFSLKKLVIHIYEIFSSFSPWLQSFWVGPLVDLFSQMRLRRIYWTSPCHFASSFQWRNSLSSFG